MDAAKTNSQSAGADFAHWVQQYPCFSNYFYLSFFYQTENELDKALEAIEKSLDFPLHENVYAPDLRNVYSYASDSILVALTNERYDLAIRLCDAALAQLEHETGKYSSAPYWKPKLQKLKEAIIAEDRNAIDRWFQYKSWAGSFNPYQARNTNATQRIKLGNNFFPSDEYIKARERPWEEIEPIIDEW
jgi:tetratricopeptide (TPR) repeat protein